MKTTIITGSSRGLGRDMALRVAQSGTDVIVTYHCKQDEAQQVVSQIEAMGRQAVALQLDTGDIASFDAFAGEVQSALKKMGREKFDFLVNNAGVGLSAPFSETTEEEFDSMVNIHFKGVFFLTQKLLPMMNDGGRIVNVSSGLARYSFDGYSAYGSCKGAVETLSRYMAKELGARGIAVNVLAPGAIETDFGGGYLRENPELKQTLGEQTALGRVGQADDIGGVVASLLSDEMRWVNGQRIEVAGGFLL